MMCFQDHTLLCLMSLSYILSQCLDSCKLMNIALFQIDSESADLGEESLEMETSNLMVHRTTHEVCTSKKKLLQTILNIA